MCTLLLCFDIDFCSIKLLKWNRNCSLSEKEYKIFNIGPEQSQTMKKCILCNEWNIKNRLWVLFLPKSKKFYDVHTIRRRFIHERLLRCREKVNREIKYLKCFPSLVKINLILMELENWEEEKSGHRSANRNIHQTSIRNETIAYQATLAKSRDGERLEDAETNFGWWPKNTNRVNWLNRNFAPGSQGVTQPALS